MHFASVLFIILAIFPTGEHLLRLYLTSPPTRSTVRGWDNLSGFEEQGDVAMESSARPEGGIMQDRQKENARAFNLFKWNGNVEESFELRHACQPSTVPGVIARR